ncbi:hypothetical protein ABPG74_015276 [Tetrahymena malaccensis]
MGNKQQKSDQINQSQSNQKQNTQQIQDQESNMNFNQLKQQLIKEQQKFSMLGVSLVIARNNQGKFLAVKENYDQGWWIPGGLVDPPEDFVTAAIRETQEEAGIDIEIKGILRIEQNFNKSARYKVVFYGEPKDQNQKPKQIPDSESQEARWVTLKELEELGKKPPYLRGQELLVFGQYIEKGGPIYPLSIIETTLVDKFDFKKQVDINQKSNMQIEYQLNQQNNQIQKVQQNETKYVPLNVKLVNAPTNRMIGLSLIVIRNQEGKFLAVKETNNRGWWLPGGKVDPPEDFISAAIRESKEEAGIDINVKGVLRIEQDFTGAFLRYKVVFYAEPIDQKQKPKDFADNESEEARWVTLNELRALGKNPPYLRGNELIEYGQYLEKGGPFYPLDIINQLK